MSRQPSPQQNQERQAYLNTLESHDNAHKQHMAENPNFFTDQADAAFTKFPKLKQTLTNYLETPKDKQQTLTITPYHDEPSKIYHYGSFLNPTSAFCPDNPVYNLCCHLLYELHKEYRHPGANGFSVQVGLKAVVSIKAQPEGSSIYDDVFLLDAYNNALQSQLKQYWDSRPPIKKRKPYIKVQQAWVNAALREQPAGIACIAVSVLGCLGALMVSAQITDTNTVMVGLFAASAALLIAGIVLVARACHANKKLKQRNPCWRNCLDKKKQLTELLPSS